MRRGVLRKFSGSESTTLRLSSIVKSTLLVPETSHRHLAGFGPVPIVLRLRNPPLMCPNTRTPYAFCSPPLDLWQAAIPFCPTIYTPSQRCTCLEQARTQCDGSSRSGMPDNGGRSVMGFEAFSMEDEVQKLRSRMQGRVRGFDAHRSPRVRECHRNYGMSRALEH